MKFIARLFLSLVVLLLFTSLFNAQNKLRKLEDAKEFQAKLPITIVSRDVGKSKIADDGTVLAGPDWVKDLTLTIKNTSQKNIVFIQIDLILVEDKRIPQHVQFPIRFGVPFWMDDSGKVHVSDRNKLLRSNESAVIAVTEQEAITVTNLLKRYNAEDFTHVRVQVREIQFDDDTGWSLGHEWRRDRKNRNKRLPLNDANPEHQTTFLSADIIAPPRDVGSKPIKSGQKPEIRKDLPIVDFAVAESKVDVGRQKINGLFDVPKDLAYIRTDLSFKESDLAESFDLPLSHGGPDALPVYASDLVLSGIVASKQAFLSNDKTSVYTELELKIDQVFKRKRSDPEIGQLIRVTRRGGKVRMPSGKVLIRAGLTETMPNLGGRYILFLNAESQVDGYRLITGYEIRNSHVYPLDGVASSPKIERFAIFEGMKEKEFVSRLVAALVDGEVENED